MTSEVHDIYLLDKIARHLGFAFENIYVAAQAKTLFVFTSPQDFNHRVLFPKCGFQAFASPALMLELLSEEKNLIVIKAIDNPFFGMSKDEMKIFLDINS